PARSAYPSCPHPGDERRQLPPQAEPPQTDTILRTMNLIPSGPASGEKRIFRYAPEALLPRILNKPILQLLAYFYSVPVAWFYGSSTILVKSVERDADFHVRRNGKFAAT